MKKSTNLEEFKSWRLLKAVYWIVTGLTLIYTLTQSIAGGVLIALLVYPVYWIVRRAYIYIEGIDYQEGESAKKRKTSIKEIALVLLLLLITLLTLGFIMSRSYN